MKLRRNEDTRARRLATAMLRLEEAELDLARAVRELAGVEGATDVLVSIGLLMPQINALRDVVEALR